MSQAHLSDTRFDQFDLPEPLQKAIAETGFELCTPIQASTLPLTLEGRNVMGQAKTGTGKTAAFLIAAVNRLLRNPPLEGRPEGSPRALILAPTRELAIQIHKDAETLAKHSGLRLAVAYGGTDYEKQRKQLAAGVDILIGTPGRIIDYFKQKVFSLKGVEVMVLDEADRMFDLGFIKDIRFLLRRLPPPEKRLNLLFSATLSYRVTELAYEHMHNPELIKVEMEEMTTTEIDQSCYYVANSEKIPLLLGLFKKFQPERTIIFVNTKHAAEDVYRYLVGNDINTAILSGDVPQKKRQRLVSEFQEGKFPVLVATDVAARGLHIPEVSHVINYDLPQDSEDYVHRIGRTGRIGAKGHAISLVCETYAFHLPDVESFIGKRIPSLAVEKELLIEPKPPAPREKRSRPPQAKGRGRRGGGRSEGGSGGEGGKPRRRRKPAAKKPAKPA